MNTVELAEYLSMGGHSVYEKEGVDIEALLLGHVTPRPINYDKLKLAAEEEGFILTDVGWVKERIKVS